MDTREGSIQGRKPLLLVISFILVTAAELRDDTTKTVKTSYFAAGIYSDADCKYPTTINITQYTKGRVNAMNVPFSQDGAISKLLMLRNVPSGAPFTCSIDGTLEAAGLQSVSFQIECNSTDPGQYLFAAYSNKRCEGTPKYVPFERATAVPFVTGRCFRSTILSYLRLAPADIWMKYNASLVEIAGQQVCKEKGGGTTDSFESYL